MRRIARGCVATAFALVLGAAPAFSADAPTSPAPSAIAPTAGPPHTESAYSPQGADTCLGCHNYAAVTGIFRTKHAQPGDPRGPFGRGGLQCEACHGPGGAHVTAGGGPLAGMVDFGPKALAPALKQNAQCLACHQSNAAQTFATSAHAASGQK